ncbi:hypothetical protein FI667_g11946, partial [Globisporangium splendens]
MSEFEPLRHHDLLDCASSAPSPGFPRSSLSSDYCDDLSALDHFLAGTNVDDCRPVLDQEQFVHAAAPSHSGSGVNFPPIEIARAAQRHRRAIALALRPRLPKTKKKAPKRRIRPKDQLDTLRVTVLDLQRNLDVLRASAAAKESASRKEKSETKSMNLEKRDKLNRSKEVNVHLRKMLQVHLRFTHRLADELRRSDSARLLPGLLDCHSLPKKSDTESMINNADWEFFYEALNGTLDATFAQTEGVFAGHNLFKTMRDFNDAQVILDGEQQTNLQVRSVKLLPFEFQAVSDAVWRLVRTESVEWEHGLFFRNDNVVLMKKTITLSLGEGSDEDEDRCLQAAVRAVSKRYFASKDRIVVCWEGSAEWPQDSVELNGCQSVPMREKVWIVIQRVPGNPGMSVMQSCMLAKLGASIEDTLKPDRPNQLERILELAIPSYQRVFDVRYQTVENMLFDSKAK